MLIERAKALKDLLPGLREKRDEAGLEERLARMQRDLTRWSLQVQNELNLLRSFEHPTPRSIVEKAATVRQQVAAYRNAMAGDRDESERLFGVLNNSLNSFVPELKQENLERWNQAKRSLPRISEKVLSVFRGAPLLSEWATKMVDLRSRLVEGLPSSENSLKAQLRLHREILQHFKGMPGQGIPQAVLAFLQEATNRGAGLELLTPEVVNWLTAHGLLTEFVVKTGET